MAEFFEDQRVKIRNRKARRELHTPNRRAVVTMVHNEPVFLPIWLRYYSRFFGPEDIYVLDHETSDGSTSDGGFVRIPVEHDRIDWTWMANRVAQLQNELIDRYDVVLAIDVDEIVAPDPSLGTLGDYLDDFGERWVNCLGYELIHMRDREPPISFDLPILEQRGFWFANDAYDKPALATEAMRWKPGFHHRADGHYNLDPDLRLIHLHRMDYDICRDRHLLRRERAWSDQDVQEKMGTHNLITEESDFDRWFYEDSSIGDIPIVVEPIPQEWRELF
jgi:hypothetical protein